MSDLTSSDPEIVAMHNDPRLWIPVIITPPPQTEIAVPTHEDQLVNGQT